MHSGPSAQSLNGSPQVLVQASACTVTQALVGLQGGLLAASTKIKQIDRLIRLRTDADPNEAWVHCRASSAGSYPFTPYTCVHTLPARTHEIGDTRGKRYHSPTSDVELAINVEAPERRKGGRDNSADGSTNEADAPIHAAASLTPFNRTRERIQTLDKDGTPDASPVGPNMSVTRNCVASTHASHDAAIPNLSAAVPPPECRKSGNAFNGECGAAAAFAGLTSVAPATPVAALASGYRGKTCGTRENSGTANAPSSSFQRRTDECTLHLDCLTGTRLSPPDAADYTPFTVETGECPDAYAQGASEEKRVLVPFAAMRWSKRDVCPEWKSTACEIGLSESCSDIKNCKRDPFVAPPASLPSVPDMSFCTAPPSCENICFTEKREDWRSTSFPRFPPSSAYSTIPPSAPAGGPDIKEERLGLYNYQKDTEFLPDHSSAVGRGELDNHMEKASVRPTGVRNESEALNAGGLPESHRDQFTAVFHRTQENRIPENSSERRQMCGETTRHLNFQTRATQHEDAGGQKLGNTPNNSCNEDVSWAADLVSRWRAQRR